MFWFDFASAWYMTCVYFLSKDNLDNIWSKYKVAVLIVEKARYLRVHNVLSSNLSIHGKGPGNKF